MIDVAFAIPGNITLPTGGYGYARKVLNLLPDYGVEAHHLQLPTGYPFPDQNEIAATRRTFAQLHPDTPVLVDGLAFGAMPPELIDDIRAPLAALVHHPLAFETGLTAEQAQQLLAYERYALKRAGRVIATSDTTARLLANDYAVAETKLIVAEPGTVPALRARGSGSPLQLLAVGALIPRKGYTYLIEALSKITNQDWHLTIVGALDHDPGYATEVREAIMRSGLRRQIKLAGYLSDHELQRTFAHCDIFVMPSLFEGYGMVLTEAIARGLPIVSTTGGALSETVPHEAAIKVEPGDSDALASALDQAINDRELRTKLGNASWAIGRRLPRWEDCAKTIASVMKVIAKKPELRVPS